MLVIINILLKKLIAFNKEMTKKTGQFNLADFESSNQVEELRSNVPR